MATTKLTLSVEKALIRDAKRVAAKQHTSVSAIFSRFVKSLATADGGNEPGLGPITSRASGIARLPKTRSDRRLVEDALPAKYRSHS